MQNDGNPHQPGYLREELERLNAISARYVEFMAEHRLERFRAPLDRQPVKAAFIEAFRSGSAIEPRFEYEPVDPSMVRHLDALADQLNGEVTGALGFWWHLLASELAASSDTWGAHVERSSAAITAASTSLHGLPTPTTLARAQAIADTPVLLVDESDDIDAEEAAELVSRELARVGLDNWAATVSRSMNARMSVSAVDRTIRIREDARFSRSAIRRLLIHEVSTHAFRAANGAAQPLQLLGHGLRGYLATEEGLAVWHESQSDVIDPATMRKYAVRALAVDLSRTAGFCEIFQFAQDHLTPDEAFDIALRIKRGMSDPGEPGGDVKDHVYLSGHLAVTDFLAASPQHHQRLMCGKVSIDWISELDALDTMGLLVPPQFALDPG